MRRQLSLRTRTSEETTSRRCSGRSASGQGRRRRLRPDTASAVEEEVAGRLSEAPDQQSPWAARPCVALRRGAVPTAFRAQRQKAEGQAVRSATGIVARFRPPGFSSEFALVDGEAPDRKGVKHHAGKDWFAPGNGGPVAGVIIEALVRHDDTPGPRGAKLEGLWATCVRQLARPGPRRPCRPYAVRGGGRSAFEVWKSRCQLRFDERTR